MAPSPPTQLPHHRPGLTPPSWDATEATSLAGPQEGPHVFPLRGHRLLRGVEGDHNRQALSEAAGMCNSCSPTPGSGPRPASGAEVSRVASKPLGLPGLQRAGLCWQPLASRGPQAAPHPAHDGLGGGHSPRWLPRAQGHPPWRYTDCEPVPEQALRGSPHLGLQKWGRGKQVGTPLSPGTTPHSASPRGCGWEDPPGCGPQPQTATPAHPGRGSPFALAEVPPTASSGEAVMRKSPTGTLDSHCQGSQGVLSPALSTCKTGSAAPLGSLGGRSLRPAFLSPTPSATRADARLQPLSGAGARRGPPPPNSPALCWGAGLESAPGMQGGGQRSTFAGGWA